MSNMIIVGRAGAVAADRIIVVLPVNSAPVKRMLEDTPDHLVLDMTYGYSRKSAVIFDNGFVAILTSTVADVIDILDINERMPNVDDPVSW